MNAKNSVTYKRRLFIVLEKKIGKNVGSVWDNLPNLEYFKFLFIILPIKYIFRDVVVSHVDLA